MDRKLLFICIIVHICFTNPSNALEGANCLAEASPALDLFPAPLSFCIFCLTFCNVTLGLSSAGWNAWGQLGHPSSSLVYPATPLSGLNVANIGGITVGTGFALMWNGMCSESKIGALLT